MAAAKDWRTAFARQATSDLAVFDLLVRRQMPICHQLHYLQMTCEKMVKGYLYTGKTVPANVQSSHAVIKKHLVGILAEQYRRRKGKVMRAPMRQAMLALAEEIEVLAPAVDRGGARSDNCEYPWETVHGEIQIPSNHPFSLQRLLEREAGRELFKLLRTALQDLR